MKRLSILFIAIVSVQCSLLSKNCLQNKGAIDIGSGSTKAFAAIVDICEKKIVKTLFERQMILGFGEALAKSGKEEIPEALIQRAGNEIANFVNEMRKADVKDVSAIATAAFRKAKNGSHAAGEIGRLAKISVTILTQDQEADVGALSARSRLGIAANDQNSVVWDIGGGSMQMWARTSKGVEIFKGDLASVSFKNRVLEEILKKDIKKASSPNPLGKKHVEATQMAIDHATKNVPDFFRKGGLRWLGIGGVLSISIKNQTKKPTFTAADLKITLLKNSTLTDRQIHSDYRATEVTNLALVLGYMKALQIEKVETVEASLAQGWLLH